ncbi:transcription antitermination factor NusB [Gemmatimonadota bacterium Y43]|uniref:RsmB/NOP family class I SAM-dependent RNA methyltransferase n=1 Tax=Gaopeijia maritima TaxID=3119007 RepID=UPI00329254C6
MTGDPGPGRDARATALDVLAEVGRGRRLDRAFGVRASAMPPRERRFAQELAYGVVRLRGRLDHLLAAEVRGGLDRLSPGVLDLLRLGAYQLMRLDGVPDYAAVSATVDLARERGEGRAAGLINAVLRALVRNGTGVERFPDRELDAVGYLARYGSHPRWLVDRWLASASVDAVAARIEADNAVPPLFFVPAGDAAEAEGRIAALGGRAQPAGRGSGALRVDEIDPAALLAAVPGWIQDPGAALVARYAHPPTGGIVADLCAAPGGKALYLARRAAYVVAADRSAPRLPPLRDNVARVGARIGVVRARAEEPPVRGADLVLVDVPCTGTGTLRRHPDARWRLSAEAPQEMARVQERILNGVARSIPEGGLLVYSTCALEPEENEERVAAFLESHPDFRIEPPDELDLPDVGDDGLLRVLPERTGFDGAFAARLRRGAAM